MPRYYLMLAGLILLAAANASSQWEWQTPSPQGNDLFHVDFIDSANGWAVGEYGTILHTTDGGTSWVEQEYGRTDNILSVSVVSPLAGWAAGDNGVMLHTTNGGDDWVEQNSGVTVGLNTVTFIDSLSGWAAGDNETIIHTTNGGSSWNIQFSSHSPISINSIIFRSPTDGWAVGATGKVYHTTDGGTLWIRQSLGVSTTDFFDITFGGTTTGIITGSHGTIFQSTDDGTSWNTITPVDTVNNNTVIMQNGFVGWIAGDGGRLLRTINSGASWSRVIIAGGMDLNGFCVNGSRQWVVGELGSILRSTNSGIGWTSLDNGSRQSINWIDFASATGGYAVGQQGLLLHTTNAGITWTQQTSPVPLISCYGVKAIDDLHAWAVGDNGTIIRTTDGTGWSAQTSPTTATLLGVTFGDASNGWILGGEFSGFTGLILHSSDGGGSWAIQKNSIPAVLFGGDFISSTTGWAVGSGGYVMKTTDGGGSWSTQYSAGTATLYWCSFADASNGWAVGDSGRIIHTTNGGTTWVKQTSGLGVSLFSVSAVSPLVALVAGDQGTLLRTTDGGAHWIQDYSRTPHSFYSMTHSTSAAYACGDYGTVEQFIFPVVTGSISGVIYNDLNQNGVRDPGEPGLPGWQVNLQGVSAVWALTGPDGSFEFDNLLYGDYSVTENLQQAWSRTAPLLPTGYQVTLDTTTPNVVCNFGNTAPNTIRYDIYQGWDLISLPLVLSNQAVGTVFPSATSRAFSYSGRYYEQTSILSGVGYWVKFGASQTVWIAGDPINADTLTLNSGWNMVGSITQPLPVASITSNPPGLTTSRFFNYTAGQYLRSDTLTPGRAFWVKLSQAGQLILNPAAYSSLRAITVVPDAELPPAPPGTDDVGGTNGIPKQFSLSQNYPNPFNPTTSLSLDLGAAESGSLVSVRIYDVLGREVAVLADARMEAGKYTLRWDASAMSSGVYFCRLELSPAVGARPTITRSLKMLLIR